MKTILVICSLTVLSHCVLSQEGKFRCFINVVLIGSCKNKTKTEVGLGLSVNHKIVNRC